MVSPDKWEVKATCKPNCYNRVVINQFHKEER